MVSGTALIFGPPLGYSSNGEAGDGETQCTGCDAVLDEPHSWQECIEILKKERNRLGDLLMERDICVVCGGLLIPLTERFCEDTCAVAYVEGVRFKEHT